MFSVLEFALFMSRQRLSHCRRNPGSQFGAGSQTKQPQGCAFHCPISTYGIGGQAALLATDVAAWLTRANHVFLALSPCSPVVPFRLFPRQRSRECPQLNVGKGVIEHAVAVEIDLPGRHWVSRNPNSPEGSSRATVPIRRHCHGASLAPAVREYFVQMPARPLERIVDGEGLGWNGAHRPARCGRH